MYELVINTGKQISYLLCPQ